jgi:tRNA 2-thiouridine synthesizing protein E
VATINIGGSEIEVDDEGYLLDYRKWNREIAAAIARTEYVELGDRHFVVIDYLRKTSAATGSTPGIFKTTKESGVPTKELYALFPNGPLLKAAKIAGIKKPASCV